MEQCTESRIPFGDIGEYKKCDMDKDTDTSSLQNGDLERQMEQCEKDVEEILNRTTRSFSRRRYAPVYEGNICSQQCNLSWVSIASLCVGVNLNNFYYYCVILKPRVQEDSMI